MNAAASIPKSIRPCYIIATVCRVTTRKKKYNAFVLVGLTRWIMTTGMDYRCRAYGNGTGVFDPGDGEFAGFYKLYRMAGELSSRQEGRRMIFVRWIVSATTETLSQRFSKRIVSRTIGISGKFAEFD